MGKAELLGFLTKEKVEVPADVVEHGVNNIVDWLLAQE